MRTYADCRSMASEIGVSAERIAKAFAIRVDLPDLTTKTLEELHDLHKYFGKSEVEHMKETLQKATRIECERRGRKALAKAVTWEDYTQVLTIPHPRVRSLVRIRALREILYRLETQQERFEFIDKLQSSLGWPRTAQTRKLERMAAGAILDHSPSQEERQKLFWDFYNSDIGLGILLLIEKQCWFDLAKADTQKERWQVLKDALPLKSGDVSEAALVQLFHNTQRRSELAEIAQYRCYQVAHKAAERHDKLCLEEVVLLKQPSHIWEFYCGMLTEYGKKRVLWQVLRCSRTRDEIEEVYKHALGRSSLENAALRKLCTTIASEQVQQVA